MPESHNSPGWVPDPLPALVAIVGPTAVGKTALAIDLAMRTGAEIISADSRLFYRGMDIGTAKPSASELAAVPHHLISFLNPDQAFSLSDFQQAVYRIAAEIHARGRLPLLVGGTGQYVRSVSEGWLIPSRPPRPDFRDTLERQAVRTGAAALHRWLEVLDPPAAASIDPHNARRTIRALEVIFSTGRPFSDQSRAAQPRFRVLTIGLIRPRNELYARADERIAQMFEDGLIDEVESLLKAGYSPTLPSMSAIGYHEVALLLAGQIDMAEATARMKKRTRTLIRRQANWFKLGDPGIRWFGESRISESLVALITKIR